MLQCFVLAASGQVLRVMFRMTSDHEVETRETNPK